MKTLSIIIPVYNEINTLPEVLKKVEESQLPEDIKKEIIIIDDFSTDGTRDFLRQLTGRYMIIFQDKNRGKGAALREGFRAATGDYIIIQDADLEYDPNDYFKIIEPLRSGKADVVYGSRFLGGETHRVLYFWHMVGNKFLTLLSNMLTNLTLTDMETGYKAFKSSIIKAIDIEEDRFGFEPEITAKVAKFKCRIYEVGISYHGRTYEEGKKIGWKDGFRAIWCIIKYNLFR